MSSSRCSCAGGGERVAGGPDGLVGLLRVLHLAGVLPRRRVHVLLAVELAGLVARGVDGRLRQRRRVGTHIGDVAVLVQPLRDAHRALGGEPQLAAGLLLQRRGHERRVRPAGVGLLLDRRPPTGWRRAARRPAHRPRPRRGPAPRRACATAPSESKSRPVATRLPSTLISLAVNRGGEAPADRTRWRPARRRRPSRRRCGTPSARVRAAR